MKRFFLQIIFLVSFVASGSGRPTEDEGPDGIIDDSNLVPTTLEQFYSGYFSASGFTGSWASPNEIFMIGVNETLDIMKFNVQDLTTSVFLDASVMANVTGVTFSLSPDEAYLLIGHTFSFGWRSALLLKYYVYEIANRNYIEIANGETLPLATWAPAGSGLVYVLENNVYYAQLLGDGRVNERQLTFDGVDGIIYNGVPDWVYQEEIFGVASALWIAPDGNHLVIASFNDTEVQEATYYEYGTPGDMKSQYPEKVTIKYPKSGSKNPTVSLRLIDLTNTSASWIDLPAPVDVVEEDHIIYTVSWLTNDGVLATWTNRVQNVAQSVLYNSVTGEGTYLLTLKEPEGWVDVPTPILHEGFLLLLKSQDSGTSAGAFLHLTRYNLTDGILSEETDLTPGTQSVTSFYGIDARNERAYFLATGEGAPSQRNLYFVPLDGSETPTCVSCSLQTPEGNNCLYASASFSTDRSYYALTCSGPDPATSRIYDSNHTQVYSWEENESLRDKISRVLKPVILDLTVNVNGYDARVRLYLPPQLDQNDVNTKYPMLVQTYAGPDTTRVTDSAAYGLQNYMATNRSVIFANIDGRGSSHKGSKMLYEIYRNMGTVEIQDQIDVTKILQQTYGWIDAERTAIWGWSYGGFSSTFALAKDTDSVFKCAISVAPVSSWIYYDTMYTERYMGLPTEEDNLAGYNASDITRLVEGIRGKKYMLIHGTADDNVHYQQSMALGHALAAADIQFEQVSYTDQAHSLSGVSPHLYHTMDNFWGKCLDLEDIY